MNRMPDWHPPAPASKYASVILMTGQGAWRDSFG